MTDTFIRYWVYGTIGVIAFVLGIIVMQLSRSDDVGSRGISGADSCNVALIRAQGQLYTYTWLAPAGSEENSGNSPGLAISAEDIVRQISNANQDPAIEAVVLQVDSTGGSVVAGEEIANELRRVSKPSVALIRAEGLSAAYWAAWLSTKASPAFLLPARPNRRLRRAHRRTLLPHANRPGSLQNPL